VIRTLIAAVLAFAMGVPGAVAAEGSSYFTGAIGTSALRNLDADGTTFRARVDTDTAFSGLIGVGRHFGEMLRGEIDLSYTPHDVDKISGAQGSGDVTSWAVGGTLFMDFDIPSLQFTPYVGIGAGVIRVDLDNVTPVGGSVIDGGDTAPYIQAVAGVSYDISDRLSLFGDLRYRASQRLDLTTRAGSAVSPDYSDRRVMVGLRWRFAAPPPPPPPPAPAPAAAPKAEPAPAPRPQAQAAPAPKPEPEPKADIPREYLVFFDWDRSDITAEADQIIRAAAANARELRTVRITTTGHADRSGPDAYNVGLSQRRAIAVREVLVREGIPVGEIEIFARGESEPLVPTPDGVREPRNRRVQIILN
jgi:OOP family OmpA-OmpF porin